MATKKRKKSSPGRWAFRILALTALAAFFFFIGLYFLVKGGLFGEIPGEVDLERIQNNTAARILSSDGQLLGLFYFQNRTNTRFEEISPPVIQALLATEDVRFYKHNGFDLRGTSRGFIRSILLLDRTGGGGSTLSQQLAKNLYPRKNYWILTLPVAKIKEAVIAIRLEKVYSKEQILELYLNTVSFGENTYGIETASLTFFNKQPGKLKMEEAALLVGLLKANTSYNPRNNPEAALKRRNIVLSQMGKYDFLSVRSVDSLSSLPIRLDYHRLDHVEGPAPYFREYLRHKAAGILDSLNKRNGSNYNLYTDGLNIHTTLDSRIQAMAERAAAVHLSYLQDQLVKEWGRNRPWRRDLEMASLQITQSDVYKSLVNSGMKHSQAIEAMKKSRETRVFTWQGIRDTVMSPLDSILHHFEFLQCGVMAMDRNGSILAWVGGANYRYFKYDHVTARRQIGSTFKPVVYAAALDQGMDPCDFYPNDSISYPEYDDWSPRNAGSHYGGYYSMKGALVNSVNTVSVQVLVEAGIENTIGLAHKMGIESELPVVPSLALGAAEVPLYEMVRAYSVFLNNGQSTEPFVIRRIEDSDGKVIYKAPGQPAGEEVLSSYTAQVMLALLEGVVERGTASALRDRWGFTNALAGKTGTTQDQADGWFIGITPDIVTGVWIGGDSQVIRFRSLSKGQGSRTAMPVFAYMIKEMEKDPETAKLLKGSFNIQESIPDVIDCEDYRDDLGFRLFERKEQKKTRPERKPSRTIEKDDEGKVGKFFRKIFGKKEKRK